jgi:hypothetical protein
MAASSNTELTKEPTCHFPPGSNASLTANEETPDSFSLFHKLPIELRLKIWRYTFPRGRYVDLDDYNGFPIYSSFQTNGHLGKEPWLPIALSVNKESRQETLRHYIIVFLEDPVPRRICYNPSPDAAFMEEITPWQGRAFSPYFKLKYEAPRIYTATKVLRLHRWLNIWNYTIYKFRRNPVGRLEMSYGGGDRDSYYADALFRFTDLEELRVVLPKRAEEFHSVVLHRAESLREQIIEFLQENGEVWGGKVPRVTIEESVELVKLWGGQDYVAAEG